MSNHTEPAESKEQAKFDRLYAERIKKLKDRRITAYEFLWASAFTTAGIERQKDPSKGTLNDLAKEIMRELVERRQRRLSGASNLGGAQNIHQSQARLSRAVFSQRQKSGCSRKSHSSSATLRSVTPASGASSQGKSCWKQLARRQALQTGMSLWLS